MRLKTMKLKSTDAMASVKDVNVSKEVDGFVSLGFVESCKERMALVKEENKKSQQNLNCQLTIGFDPKYVKDKNNDFSSPYDEKSLEILIRIFDNIEQEKLLSQQGDREVIENSNMNRFSLLEFDSDDEN